MVTTKLTTLTSDQAVDLNLKLMRWRILPMLDSSKRSPWCRHTWGWAVCTITFVDSSCVSFSNPCLPAPV
ncbi:hypothetical protein HD554DRAFT_1016486 [Boletus coccyginus]|nr:hypothetical protein HD554DRAFT_1016486 [Boletus coccyginus]